MNFIAMLSHNGVLIWHPAIFLFNEIVVPNNIDTGIGDTCQLVSISVLGLPATGTICALAFSDHPDVLRFWFHMHDAHSTPWAVNEFVPLFQH